MLLKGGLLPREGVHCAFSFCCKIWKKMPLKYIILKVKMSDLFIFGVKIVVKIHLMAEIWTFSWKINMQICAHFWPWLQKNVWSDSFQPLIYYDQNTHLWHEPQVILHLHLCTNKGNGGESTIFCITDLFTLICINQKLFVRKCFLRFMP